MSMEKWVMLLQVCSVVVFSVCFVTALRSNGRIMTAALYGMALLASLNLTAAILMLRPWLLFDVSGLSSGTTIGGLIISVVRYWISGGLSSNANAVLGVAIVLAESIPMSLLEKDMMKIML